MDEYKRRFRSKPDNNAALFNSGITLHKLGRDAEAESIMRNSMTRRWQEYKG